MTDEEIMTRIASLFSPFDPNDRASLSVEVQHGAHSDTLAKGFGWTATLAHRGGKIIGHGGTQRSAIFAMLRNTGKAPLTMDRHLAFQALRVEVGL